MDLYNLDEKKEYIEEFVLLCHQQWGHNWNEEEFSIKLQEKINNTIIRLKKFPTFILLDHNILVGFVSLFEKDGEELQELTPWYATLYVKEKYRGKGLSKTLNDIIIEEAKKLNYEKLYLKTDLINFYENYGFKYLDTLANQEKVYYMNLHKKTFEIN